MTEKIKIIFLGTSGAIPSPERNHPAMLLIYNGENILIDCGEGTQTQFKKARISAFKLTRLLITHWHGDHVLGIPGLLQTLSFNDYNKTLRIYGPRGIKNHFDNVLRAFPSVMVSDLRNNLKIEVSEAYKRFIDEKDFYVGAFPVSHGIPSNGYCFSEKDKIMIDKRKLKKFGIKPGKHLAKLKEGKDIIFNGKEYKAKDLTFKKTGKKICVAMDGLYAPGIVPFVKNSDLLIMEATYSNDIANLAREHKHRTAQQCAEIAKKARVKKLVLTHLSDRYSKNPEIILQEARKIFKNTVIAKDMDVVEV